MHTLVDAFDRLLAVLAGVAMVAAFVAVTLGVVVRLAGLDVAGLDAYAGYAIAAALFLALPQTLRWNMQGIEADGSVRLATLRK